LVHTASSITDADRATLFLIDPASGDLWSKVAEGAEVKEIRVPAGAGLVGWVAQHKKFLNIADAYEDERFNRAVDVKTGYRTRSILCAPMWSLKNKILGVVQVINKRVGVFNTDDEGLLRAFAHQVNVAVENFNLYRKIMANHKKMAIMLDIAGSLGHALDLETLVSKIVSKTTEALHCDSGSFFVFDHETEELWSMAARGMEVKEIRLPMRAGLAGAVACEGEVVNVADAYHDARFNPEFDYKIGYRTRSVLCVSVHDREGRVIGVTQAINKLQGVFDAEDVDLLRAISSQIGVVLENATLHASTLNMKNYLESVQESISNSILTLDSDYQVVTANGSALKLLPGAGECNPRPDIRNLLGHRNARVIEILETVYATRTNVVEYDVELCGDRADATVNVNVVPLTNSASVFQGLSSYWTMFPAKNVLRVHSVTICRLLLSSNCWMIRVDCH
jgi:adenylate cyclase